MMCKYKNRSGERGVALIFALGILALLMIMMVAFVSSMLLQYQSSSNMSRMVDADLLADSAMNRALAIMNMLVTDAPADDDLVRNFNRVVSLAEDGNVNLDEDNTFDKNKSGSAATALEIADVYEYDPATMDEPRWIYVRSSNAGMWTKATDPIIGRFAFAVVPNFRPKMNFNAIWGLPSYSGRSGNDFREVATDLLTGLDDVEGDAGVASSTFSYIINVTDIVDYLKDYCDKHDHENLVETSTQISALEANLNKFFTAGVQGYEAYLVTDGTINKYCQRFNIAQIKERAEAASYLERVASIYSGKNTQRQPISSGDSSGAYIDPFFAKFDDPETFATVLDLKHQIVANMIDFVLPDNVTAEDTTAAGGKSTKKFYVTSNIEPEKWSDSTIPNYTGNKRTCYINEVGVVIKISVDVESDANGNMTATPDDIEYSPIVEIVDIYGDDARTYYAEMDASLIGTITISGKTSATIDFGDDYTNDNYDITSSSYITINDSSSVGSLADASSVAGYKVGNNLYTKSWSGVATRSADDASFKLDLSDFSLSLNSVKLSLDSDGTDAVDFANLRDRNSTTSTQFSGDECAYFGGIDQSSLSFSSSMTFYIACLMQTNDPRQNLNPGDWSVDDNTGGEDYKMLIGTSKLPKDSSTFGALNFSAKSAIKAMNDGNANYDPEIGLSDITDGQISTAYIKGTDEDRTSATYSDTGGYQSIWELGAVHRGIAWQTLNLKKANTVADGSSYAGGAYSKGDAEIADFVYVSTPTANGETTTYPNQYPVNFDINARPIGDNAPIPTVIKPGGTDPDYTDYYNGLPWQQMFNSVEISAAGEHYDLDGASGTKLDSDGTQDILKVIYTESASGSTIPRYGLKPFPRRSDIAEIISTATSPSGSSDAQQESVFGKVANLIEAKNDFPITTQLVVVAEIINDVGGENGNSINLKSFDDDGNEIDEDCEIGQFEDGYDQVVAKRKMLVTVQYRPTAVTTTGEAQLVITDIQDID